MDDRDENWETVLAWSSEGQKGLNGRYQRTWILTQKAFLPQGRQPIQGHFLFRGHVHQSTNAATAPRVRVSHSAFYTRGKFIALLAWMIMLCLIHSVLLVPCRYLLTFSFLACISLSRSRKVLVENSWTRFEGRASTGGDLGCSTLTKVSDRNSFRANQNYRDICIRANANNSVPIRKTFCISFDEKRLKIDLT